MRLEELFDFGRHIKSWRRFNREIATEDRVLLERLPDFPRAVLVAGCQRSGTTVLRRVVAYSDGFGHFQFTQDDELDAALILSGEESFSSTDRICFQTTYVNANVREYITTDADFQLIWVIRNPYSVVYSMVYHWRRRALNELFNRCGRSLVDATGELSPIEKACYAYVGKSAQINLLKAELPSERLLVLDYDRLCEQPGDILPQVFAFIGEPYQPQYAERINTRSIAKESRLSTEERDTITQICMPTYNDVQRHVMSLQ